MKFKHLLYGLLVVLLCAVGVLLIYGKQWAEQKLRKEITNIDGLTYDSLDIVMADRSVRLSNITFENETVHVTAKALQVKGIRVYRLLLGNKLVIENLIVDQPDLTYKNTQTQQKSKRVNQTKLPKFRIINMAVSHGKLQVVRKDESTPFLNTNFDIKLSEIENAVLPEPKKILDCISSFQLNQTQYRTKDSIYVADMASLTYTANDRQLHLDSARLKCNYGKYELGHFTGYETNWFDAILDSADIEITNLETLIFNKHVSKMVLYQPDVTVFLDKRLPAKPDKAPLLLRELLAQKANSFSIDSLQIKEGDIAYEEFVKLAEGPGRVSFNNLTGHIVDLYTYDQKHEKPPHLVARCDIYNTNRLYADISFPQSTKALTLVKGKLEPMDLTAFNTMMKYVAFTKIEQGQLNSLDFEFSYGQHESKGTMKFAYDNLKIDFLNKENAKSGGFLNEVKGFVANTFVVNSKNSYDSGKFRVGKIKAERNMEKSMFNFWWKSILSGFQSSTGVKPSEEKIDTN